MGATQEAGCPKLVAEMQSHRDPGARFRGETLPAMKKLIVPPAGAPGPIPGDPGPTEPFLPLPDPIDPASPDLAPPPDRTEEEQ